MQDRVPLYPGRVTLTPVSGQANTFDLVRADQPTQEGTPLNKANLLKDTTAALFGKTNAAVPDDILNLLSKSMIAQVTGGYTKTTIETLAVGKTITLNVSGVPKEFIVVHQGKPSSLYDDSCNGTWLLMKDIYENRAWHSSNSNSYKASTIHSYLNSTFLGLFDSDIQEAIKQVKIPYVNGTGGSAVASGANGLPAKIFLLSGYEVGIGGASYVPVDGAKLNYFNQNTGADSKRIAYLSASAAPWWLRSPYTDDTLITWYVGSNGDYRHDYASYSHGIRPALVLPSTFEVYTDSSGNAYTEQEYETKITDVLGNLISIPADQIKDGVKIATGSYTGTGTSGASHPSSLVFEFEPSLVIVTSFFSETQQTYGIFVKDFEIGFVHVLVNSALENGRSEVTWNGNTISWYSNNPTHQINDRGKVCRYVAIG